jgi:hypothetical protein
MRARLIALCLALPGLLLTPAAAGAKWLRAGLNTDKPLWGIHGGLRFGVYPGNVAGKGNGGPRGLIRVGYPAVLNGHYALINFIAVEPIVDGRRGYSELERSRLDGLAGKRLWVNAASDAVKPAGALDPGVLSRAGPGVEQLEVTLRVERFDNGAHVYVVAAQRSDTPDELRLTVHAEPDSAPMDACILTATMGNMTRARRLWLKNEVVSSLKLYPDYRGIHFAPHTAFPLSRLYRTTAGDVLVAITGDETDPATVHPFPGTDNWYYGGCPLTQYWRVPARTFGDDLKAVVNARFTYWQSQHPVPGGIAFENFEMRERFRDGRPVVFGITRKTAEQLGWKP